MVNFAFPPGLLTQGQPNAVMPLNMGQPVLSPNAPQAAQPALSQQTGATGNARGSSRMPQIPDNRIGMGEALMRIGGNIVGASANGGLSAFQAGTDSYGQIQDYNRQADMDRMAIEEARILEEQRRQDLARRAAASGRRRDEDEDEEKSAAVSQADQQIANLEMILDGLRQGNLTGPIDGTLLSTADRIGFTDFVTGSDTGSKRAFLRQLIQEFKVDETLAKVALTKGAISDREMALFMSPFPDIAFDNEGAWIEQISYRLEIARKIRAAVASDSDSGTSRTSSTSPAIDQSVIDAANAVINGG